MTQKTKPLPGLTAARRTSTQGGTMAFQTMLMTIGIVSFTLMSINGVTKPARSISTLCAALLYVQVNNNLECLS